MNEIEFVGEFIDIQVKGSGKVSGAQGIGVSPTHM